MESDKKRRQHLVSLHPADQEKLSEFCKETAQRMATVIRDITHLAVTGILVRKESKREYLDVS